MEENIYLTALDSINDGIVLLDINFDVILWNQWMKKYTLISKEDAEGRNILDLFPQIKDTFLHFSLYQARNSGHSQYHSHNFTDSYLTLSQPMSIFGTETNLKIDMNVVPIKLKKLNYTMIQIRDVTITANREKSLLDQISKNIEVEGQLHQTEFLCRFLSVNSNEIIAMIDVNGYIRYVSPACSSILGFEKEEMQNKKISEFTEEQDWIRIEKFLIKQHDLQHPMLLRHNLIDAGKHAIEFETIVKQVFYTNPDEKVFILNSRSVITD
ncbi:MAG: PAS domain-containing protein [Spirochaetia bacterium]|nr:PAS domain-containing protein [Spirochaetia bacterium]